MQLKQCLEVNLGSLGGSEGKESACSAGDLGSIPGLGRSLGGGHGNLLQDSCLENPHGQRSLAGCSPWGRRVGHDSNKAQHSTEGNLWLQKLILKKKEDISH